MKADFDRLYIPFLSDFSRSKIKISRIKLDKLEYFSTVDLLFNTYTTFHRIMKEEEIYLSPPKIVKASLLRIA